MRLVLILLFIASFISTANPISVDAYAQLPSKSLFAISPKGGKLAYRLSEQGKDILVVIDAKTKQPITAVSIDEMNPNLIYFVSEETVILVATKNVILSGYMGRYDSSWAYAVNLDSKKTHLLMQQNYGIHMGQTQLGRIVGISEDKKYAFMPAYYKETEYSLFKVNLKKRRKPKVISRGSNDTDDYFVNAKGDIIARERFHNKDNWHIVEAKLEDGWKEIYRKRTDIKTIGVLGLTPDYQSLVISGINSETNQKAFFTMSLENGAIGPAIFENPNKSVERLLTNVNRVVFGAQYSGFTPTYEFFDEKLNARMRGIAQAMPNNSFRIQDYTDDWEQIIFYMEGEHSSGDYIKYHAGRLELLSPSRPQIPPEAVYDVVEYSYEARDGLIIPTLLTLPKKESAEPAPAIMMPHGGPESYDRKGFDYMAQYFAGQGYVVIQPQFRGSDGFGYDFITKGRGEWGLKMQDDLTDALLSLSKEGTIDKERVCIVGGSYGGYAALAGVTYTPDLYKCAVSINGVSDVHKMMKDEKRDHGRDHWVIAYWNKVINNGHLAADHLKNISPINYVSDITAPVLLIHGEHDEVVSVYQSINIYDELKSQNKSVKYVELEDGDHYLSKAKNRLKAMREMKEFINKHI